MAQDPTPIQTNVFPVTVTVVADANKQLKLQFTPDPVSVCSGVNALIVYNLASPGYYFPVDGTAITIKCADASAVFPVAWIINSATLALGDYNKDQTPTSYKYTMSVISSSNGARITTDPSIDNDNTR